MKPETNLVAVSDEGPSGGGSQQIPTAVIGNLRPPLDDKPAVCDWVLDRYVSSDWDNQFVERLEMVLKKDRDGALTSEPKTFHGETKGIAVTGPARDGKTTLVLQAIKRVLGERLRENPLGSKVIYCRVKSDATVKSAYKEICRVTGFTSFPAKITIPEANDLACHRLRLAGIRIIILDEVHNLLGKDDKSVNLFLKTFSQDGGGFCLIAIGTEVLRSFIYNRPANVETAGRLLDFPLEPFPRDDAIKLINDALCDQSRDAGLRRHLSISRDPYFAHRIYEGCRGSHGRTMRLIAMAIVHALEAGGSTLEITDFEKVFNLEFLSFNPSNPFPLSDWASRATAVEEVEAAARSEELCEEGGAPRPATRKPRQNSRRKVVK